MRDPGLTRTTPLFKMESVTLYVYLMHSGGTSDSPTLTKSIRKLDNIIKSLFISFQGEVGENVCGLPQSLLLPLDLGTLCIS